jgi:hypothetical protein
MALALRLVHDCYFTLLLGFNLVFSKGPLPEQHSNEMYALQESGLPGPALGCSALCAAAAWGVIQLLSGYLLRCGYLAGEQVATAAARIHC